MEQYEKPVVDIIPIKRDIEATADSTCEGGYVCDTETPVICIMGDDGLIEE